MNEMETNAKMFQRKHRGRGMVTKVTPYCFYWEQFPLKPNGEVDLDKPNKLIVYMKSYFLDFNKKI